MKIRRRSPDRGCGWLVVAALLGLFGLVRPAHAAEFACAAGDVACLIAAIHAANMTGEADTITLAAGTYSLTAVDNDVYGLTGLPSIISPLTITGAGADRTILERTASAPSFRLIHVAAGGVLTLEGMTLRGGLSPSGSGLFNAGGTVTIAKSHLTDNVIDVIGFGGGLHNIGGTVVITDSTLARNNAGGSSSSAGGGVYSDGGTVTLRNSTVTSNVGSSGGGLFIANGMGSMTNTTIVGNGGSFGGGLYTYGAVVTMTQSAAIGNTASLSGGGLYAAGKSLVTITQNTVAGNQTVVPVGPGGGGLYTDDWSMVTITNSTLAHNAVASPYGGGGGLRSAGGPVALQNTILAGNQAATGPDCSGPVTSLGTNLIGDPTGCAMALQASDLTGGPGLGAFTDDGTPGQGYLPLLPESPAIDAGDPAACPPTDQLGQLRVTPCDIGAIEFSPVTFTLGLNHATLRAGDTLRVRLGVHNPGPTVTAAAYLGVLLPDGVTVFFVTSLAPLDGVVTRLDADPSTFASLAASFDFTIGLDVTLEDFFVYSFTGGESAGAYAIFTLLTPPGAFADGQVDPGDLLGLTLRLFTVSP